VICGPADEPIRTYPIADGEGAGRRTGT
jgi:hypothetical protein